ncbi:unnamed protein product [Blepharisma stoltei]|uniref:Tubulin--tyrosine ligase-like protein 5 n=1 Tax=Blepharisma stoltei TaxID=1481888 RepID=A0AAU9JK57_9CILI|nr:unnamed protein product [Blepharisma stoltei]
MDKSEFSYVSVAPKTQTIRGPRELSKNQWEGLAIEGTGKPRKGLFTISNTSPYIEYMESRWEKLLEELTDSTQYRVPTIDFRDVKPLSQEVYYKFYKADIKIVKKVLETAGLIQTISHDWSVLWSCGAAKTFLYQNLNEFQRINHFPNSTEITRKDNLCASIVSMQEKYGYKAFNFVPDTYVLPDEFADFYAHFHNEKNAKWIIKPPASSQGRGIYLIDSINEVPIDEPCIISQYIENPLLINDLKFDMRIYVLVTCYEPLRIYVYEEGLARFASEPYSLSQKKNRFSHLTNYSLNKKNDKFIQNQDAQCDDIGHKWSLSALMRHLETAGIDVGSVWIKIYDLIIKTVISSEQAVTEEVKKLNLNSKNCFDLFGFDVILDSNLKPWLLEVNLSPSLATDSPLDTHIKSNLLIDAFNLMGIRPFDKKKESINKLQNRLKMQTKSDISSRTVSPGRKVPFMQSTKFKEVVRDTLEEYKRRGHFIRIYPSKGSEFYDGYMEPIKLVNRYLYSILYTESMPRKTPIYNSVQTPELAVTPKLPKRHERQVSSEKPKSNEKVLLTGDDVLIEYVSRLCHAVKALKEDKLKPQWKRSIEKFITHQVWHTSDIRRGSNNRLWQRLESRLIEMKERRRRLVGTPTDEFEEQRRQVLRQFSAAELESMLKSSCRSSAIEIISSLFDLEGRGILSDVIKWLATVTEKDRVLIPLEEQMNQETTIYDSIDDTL